MPNLYIHESDIFSMCCVPGSILVIENIVVNKTDKDKSMI